MKVRKIINRPITAEGEGFNIAGGVSGAVSVNVNESGTNKVVSRQKTHVVQSSKRTKKPDKGS